MLTTRRAAAGLVTVLMACSPLVVAVTAQAEGADTSATAGADRRPPQMTRTEFRKIKDGMSQEQVRRIVGARGGIESKDDNCITRRYTSDRPTIVDKHYRVTWTLEDGGFEVYDKSAPGGYPFCPSGSRAPSVARGATDAAADGADRRAPQMTRAEYRRVRDGMSPARVRRIVGSLGRVEVDTPFCVHRSYSSGSQIGTPPFNRYGVVWYRHDGSYQVVGKYAPGSYQTCPPETR